MLSSALKEIGLEFMPANAGVYVLAKVASGAKTWDDEETAVELLREAGLEVCPGKVFGGSDDEKGWVRITFAVPEDQLREGVARLKKCFAGTESGN
jgi:aspartate/methionine/tyrosine aminotransferase